jgi:Tfp pilus assembly protein PilF
VTGKILQALVIDKLRARLLLVLCCIICYAITMRNDFALDDDFAYYNNAYVQQGVKGIPDLFTHTYISSTNLSFDYRPIAGVTFAIEKQLWGNRPHISHAINLVIYIICILLVFAFFTEIFSVDVGLAFFITLFFAIHPAHVEVVASIKNREELLSFMFCLLTFFAIYRVFAQKDVRGKVLYTIAAILLLLLSFASKLTSLPMFAVTAVILYHTGKIRQRTWFYIVMGLVFAISAAYFWKIHSISIRPIYDLENPLALNDTAGNRLLAAGECLWFYLCFMLVPYPLSFFYGYNTIPIAQGEDPIAIFSLMLHAALLVYGAVLLYRKDITGVFIFCYFITISVYTNLVMIYTGIVSERALFTPSMWFIAALCSWMYKRVNAKPAPAQGANPIVIGAITLVMGIYGVITIDRSVEWHDSISLMGHDVKHLPNSTLANYFYGCVLKLKAEESQDTTASRYYLSESKKYLHRTIDVSPMYPYGYFRLGLIYRYDEYQPDSAYYYFNKAFELNPGPTDIDYQYGRTQYEFGDKIKSAYAFADLYFKAPTDTFVVFYHALLQMKTGHIAEGKKVADRFMEMAPGYYQSHFNMGLYYELTNDPDSAAKEYETAVKLGCTDQTVYRYLINYGNTHGRQQEAEQLSKLLR